MYRCYRSVGFVLLISAALVIPRRTFAQVDTVRQISDTATEFHMTKSPTKAVLLSLVPGLGQVYLDQAWKVPIILGLGGGFLYGALIQNSRYLDESNQYFASLAKATFADSIQAQLHAVRREFYRDDRDKWWVYLGITYIANLLDAYIAANLYDFDVSDPAPSPIGTSYDPIDHRWQARIQFKF